MSTKSPILGKALFIAVVVSLMATLVSILLFSGTTDYKSELDPKEYYSLSYEEQIAWTNENEVSVRGFEYLQRVLAERYLRNHLIVTFISWFSVLLFSLLLMGAWLRNQNDS